ncbi:unnamed protein product [Enterobius vermicularis]|uniref:Chorein_N domain-containing protein n=1 Tax=Enterobius vermicularis TaxID=51028 RepID=A0A0N4VEJ1_ENTVE|nr:unnamed protein product [Enterobius vermicularis]
MTSLIKNQIIKHLSKFARNIAADQIDVKILSGKGELKNIEINEVVLTEVLELPTWLRIRKAFCNRVAVRVPWTRLRSSPIQLFIDEINVEVELTSEPLVSDGSNPLSSFSDNSYGFANRVVEGMSLYINTVEVHFDSGAFGGCFMAFARPENSQRTNISAPLRLITSSGKTRITIKKSTVDGTVLGGRLQTILDDILWVATLPQVRSAIAFYSHIMNLVKAAPKKAKTGISQSLPKPSLSNMLSATTSMASKAFRNFDFEQTSLHLYVGKIDMHLCDDTNASSEFPPDFDIENGALQVTFIRLSIDFYPSNIAGSERSSWVRYTAPNQCSTWNQKILQAHFVKLCSRLAQIFYIFFSTFIQNNIISRHFSLKPFCSELNAQHRLKRIWPQLQSKNCVIRIHDVVVQCVTDMNSKREGLFNLFMSDRKSKASLPSDQPLVHLELASFYHPATEAMPLPSNTVHLLLAPFVFLLDQRTVRWAAFIFQDISTAVKRTGATFDVKDMPESDIRVDFLMPKVIIPLTACKTGDYRYPRRLIISMSTVLMTNCGSLHSQDSSSFFKSISSNLLDLVEQVQLSFDVEHFRKFIIQLNDTMVESEPGEERFWISTSPVWIDTDYGDGTKTAPVLGDVAFHAVVMLSPNQINVAIQPQCRVRVFLDHFQLVQLTRLFSALSLFVEQLEADRKFFTGQVTNGDATPLALVAIIEQIQVNLLLPCTPIQNPYDNSIRPPADCTTSSIGMYFV